MKWVITGGCGFIGCALIGRLLKESDDQIKVFDNLAVGSRASLGMITSHTETKPKRGWGVDRVELHVGDIRDAGAVADVADGADVIVHLAANTGVGPSVENPFFDCETNVLGVVNVLEASRCDSKPRVVFASSGAPLGAQEPPLHEELAPHPASPYGASKLSGEGYCSAYFHCFDVDTVALRFGNVFGPGSAHKSSIVAKLIRQALTGEGWEIYGDGSQTRDFIYIEDLTDAIYRAATIPGLGGEIFQIATSRETSVLELIDTLALVLGSFDIPIPPTHFGEHRTGDVARNFSDTSKALSMLGWRAETALEEGLKHTIESFVQRG